MSTVITHIVQGVTYKVTIQFPTEAFMCQQLHVVATRADKPPVEVDPDRHMTSFTFDED